MNLYVYNQDEFKLTTPFNDNNVELSSNDYFICLNSSGYIHSIPHFKQPHPNVINTYFDDTIENKIKVSSGIVYYAIACTINQAKSIKEFIDKIPNNSSIHIYCAKGKSRSQAVKKFIEEYSGLKKSDYTSYNKHVYKLLCQQI